MPRLIVANLDCESEYGRKTPRSPPDRLPDPIRRMLSSAGALLCTFAGPGDRLWTPEPVDRDRLALPAARDVELLSGPLEALHPASHDEILAWGETRSIAALRRDQEERRPGDGPAPAPHDWRQALWTAHADPDVARKVNDRRYSQALAEQLGAALPGSAVLDSPRDLDRHLAAGGHRTGHREAWVLEAPFSASGRLRVRRRGNDISPDIATRIRRLFDRFGQLVFRPWVDRVSDLACTGVIHRDGAMTLFPAHGLDNDPAGIFHGARVLPRGSPLAVPEELEPGAAAAEQTAREVGQRLLRDGYRGPFGVDSFVYRTGDGSLRLHALCEINARLGFGLLARALQWDFPDLAVELRLETGPIPEAGRSGERIVPLLHPGSDDATSAWLVLGPDGGRRAQRGLP